MTIQELVKAPDEDPAVVIPHHRPDYLRQLSNELALEDNKDPDRVSVPLNEHLHKHHVPASSPNLLYLLLESIRSSHRSRYE